MAAKKALFAGSFDPLTNGHIDTIKRAAVVFDEVIVAVATNTSKKSLFDGEERVQLAIEALASIPQARVIGHPGGLTVELAKQLGVSAMIRGIRNVQDFEYEHSIALMNQLQAPEIPTVTLLASEQYRFISSSLIKEVAMFGGDISSLVPANVLQAMRQKYREQ